MNEQNTREAAVERLLTHRGPSNACGLSPDVVCGFCLKRIQRILKKKAGAASVDRVAIVREAFAEVKFTYCNGTWPKKPYDIAVIAVMDAVLAEMEKGK